MTGMETFFLACAAIGGAAFLIKVVMMCLGADHGDGDIGAVHDVDNPDSDASFKLLSLQGIFAFFLMFGLVGYAMSHASKLHAALSAAGGAAAGLASMALVAWMFSIARKLQSSGTLNLDNAVGQEGAVYLRIPPGGIGKVQVAVQGHLVILDATAEGKEELKSGERVKVVKVVNNTSLLVQKA